MRYLSFDTRDYLILKWIPENKDLTLLEIGVGLGSFANKILGKVKKYCGVDISCELIDYLSDLYKNNDFINWRCLDVCQENSILNEKFNIIFSAHTLEYVESPQGYFNFIAKHLEANGTTFVIFPNESKEKHHGITWFNNKKELLEIIVKARLKVTELLEVKETTWHRVVKWSLWGFPRSMIVRNKKTPQTFEKTEAFKIIKSTGIKKYLFAVYAKIVTNLAAMFPLYK